MQKQSFGNIPYPYRPYDFPSDFPVYAFLGNFWKTELTKPDFLHFHNGIEIGRCLDGRGMLYFNEEVSSCATGDFSVIFPQTPHIHVAADIPIFCEFIYVDVKALLNKSPYTDQLWQIFYIPQKIPPIIRQGENSNLYCYLTNIFREFHEKRPLYRDAVISLLIALFAELNRIALDAVLESDSESEGAASYIRKSLSYIYEHYNEPITISSLSSYCCISESHFRRIFKAAVGISPLEYIQHYRIRQACHYLVRRELPINLVAQKVGYATLSSFNRQFQQYMNVSPSVWLKENAAFRDNHEVRSYGEPGTKHIFQI